MSTRYPRPHKYDSLGAAARRLARVPRYGRLMAMLPRERFDRMRSEAETFWEVYTYIGDNSADDTGLLDGGLRSSGARLLGAINGRALPGDRESRGFQVRRACDLLGAVAYEMYACAARPRHAVANTEKLKKDVVNRLHRARVLDFYDDPVSKSDLHEHLNAVLAMDAGELKYLIFSEYERELRWTDITTQAFFAAYWACRWSDDGDDRELLRRWLPDSFLGTNDAYREFWRFVSEMPAEAVDGVRYERLLSPLYDGSWRDEEGLPIRSTEWIYRTWERMRETSAGRKFRGEFGQLLAGAGTLEQVAAARGLVGYGCESPFLSLCEGVHGEEDHGRFVMGAPADEDPDRDVVEGVQDNPRHRVRLSPYRLHRYCVTNAAYELFDARNSSQREFAEQVGDVGLHPVVNVNWYEAWCYARWLGELRIEGRSYVISLPSEAQWEYACRAGRSTPFTWSKGRDGNRIESDDSNFDGKYPWHLKGTSPPAKQGKYRERTVRVDGLDEDGTRISPNAWGFYHLHGNVWEWCGDWYERDYYRVDIDGEVEDPLGPSGSEAWSRVLRGGCWISRGRFCRSASRSRRTPDYRSRYYGFRLAAVPRVQE